MGLVLVLMSAFLSCLEVLSIVIMSWHLKFYLVKEVDF